MYSWRFNFVTLVFSCAVTFCSLLQAGHVMTFSDLSSVTPVMRASLGAALENQTCMHVARDSMQTTITFGEDVCSDGTDGLVDLVDILPQILETFRQDTAFVDAVAKLGPDSILASTGKRAREIQMGFEAGMLTRWSDFDEFVRVNGLVEKMRLGSKPLSVSIERRRGSPELKINGKLESWISIKNKVPVDAGGKLIGWSYSATKGLVPNS